MAKKNKISKNFTERDLVNSLWKEMKAQEKSDPTVGLVHEHLEGTIQLIGLTGGIASGKSTVSGLFAEAGLPIIDADKIAREVAQRGQKAYDGIVKEFGKKILLSSGEIDRAKLRALVFSDGEKRKKLELIIHPAIRREILKKIQSLKKKGEKRVIIDAALLFETGLHAWMPKTIVVKAAPEIQKQRLMDRDRYSSDEAEIRISSQMPIEKKAELANFVIDNSGSLEATKVQVQGILFQLQN